MSGGGFLSGIGSIASSINSGVSSLAQDVSSVLPLNDLEALRSLVPGLGGLPTGVPFYLGSIPLVGMEVPQSFNAAGGDQHLAVHDFPGGTRTIQSLGAFPFRTLSWQGLLLGPTAVSRASQLDALRVAGSPITVRFLSWAWVGAIQSFRVVIRHEWRAEYTLVFVPSADFNVGLNGQGPSSGSLLNEGIAGLAANTPVTIFGYTLPTSLTGPLQSLLTTAKGGLSAAENILSLVDPTLAAKVNFYAGAAQNVGAELLSGQNPLKIGLTEANSIAHVLGYAGVIKNAYAVTSVINTGAAVVGNAAATILSLVNPNLPSLAAQHYGDASLWPVIGKASGITDPQPVGLHTLTIPVNPPLTTTGGSVTSLPSLPSLPSSPSLPPINMSGTTA